MAGGVVAKALRDPLTVEEEEVEKDSVTEALPILELVDERSWEELPKIPERVPDEEADCTNVPDAN